MRPGQLLWLLPGLIMVSAAGAAQQVSSGEYRTSVVELYTSEGCNSCPPADEFLMRLGNTVEAERIVPLAFHVDYWDYIGWKDPYASPQYTQRQRMIARNNEQSTIYTPEFVVDGSEARGGRGIESRVSQALEQPAEADLLLKLSDIVENRLLAEVEVSNIEPATGELVLYIAVYESGLSSRVDAGENRGRELRHDFVVRHLGSVPVTQPGGQHQFELRLGDDWQHDALGVAAFVQRAADGRTLQAVKTSL